MNYPKVSIITPSYNQGKFIEETIISVRRQTYKNIEFIIIDACSNDETSDVLRKYRNFIDVLIVEKDNGQADAINKGIKLATGDLIGWINSDDVLYENAVEQVVDLFKKNENIDFIYGDINLINEESKKIGVLKGRQISKPSVFYELDLPIPQQGSMWRRRVNDGIGLLVEKWHYVLDRDFFLRICVKYKVLYLPITLGAFRQHFDSKSVTLQRKWIQELPLMYRDLLDNYTQEFISKFFRLIILSSVEIHCAYISLSLFDIIGFFKHFIKAIFRFPLIILLPHIYYKLFYKIKKSIFGSTH